MGALMASKSAPRRLGVDVYEPAWLEAALHASGWTQAAIARELEIDPKTVSNWLAGRHPIYRLSWYAITHALGLPKDWQPPASELAAEPDPE
jgi:transcriptional regulator with XRE-family HTH domain